MKKYRFKSMILIVFIGLPLFHPLLAQVTSPPKDAAYLPPSGKAASGPAFPGSVSDLHGYVCHSFPVAGCGGVSAVEPQKALPGRLWVWRPIYWDIFPGADIAFLKAGFYVVTAPISNAFGCPYGMRPSDVFYAEMTAKYGFHKKVVLEGLSVGALYSYRWAAMNADKVCCIYGDSAVCDMKSWPDGKGEGSGNAANCQAALRDYHFTEQQMMDFEGNPIDILAPLAAAHVGIIHVCRGSDTAVPEKENTDILGDRYMKLGVDFALIVKQGCNHHPHGLTNSTPIVNFLLAHCAEGDVARQAIVVAPGPGSVLRLAGGQW